MRLSHLFLAVALTAAGCYETYPAASIEPVPPAGPTVVAGDQLPAGTRLVAALDQPIGTDLSFPGQAFTATVMTPIVDASGRPIIPEGARLFGHVAELHSGYHGEPAVVGLAIESLTVGGVERPLQARVIGADIEVVRHGPRAGHVLGGAISGAVLGGIFGGGKGALIGSGVGAGTGALISLGTRRDQARLPAGSALGIEILTPVSVATLRPPYG